MEPMQPKLTKRVSDSLFFASMVIDTAVAHSDLSLELVVVLEDDIMVLLLEQLVKELTGEAVELEVKVDGEGYGWKGS